MASDAVKIPKFEVSKVERKSWNQRDSELVVSNPAEAKGPVKAAKVVGEVSMANGLGTPRPTHFLTGLSDDNSRLYFMPTVNSDDPDALEITYGRSGFAVNLYNLFVSLGRLVVEGTKEIYSWQATAEVVEVGGVTGRAFFIDLAPPRVETIRSKKSEAK